MYLGDFKEDGDVFFKFTTRAFATGIPTVLAGSPVLSVFIDENTTGKTTAEAYFDLDVSLGSIVGYNNVRIDLSGDAFFETGGDYTVAITTGTVDSVSVVGEVVGYFSIENRSMGQPAGATLAADIAAIKAETALIVTDTGTTLQAELDAIQAAVITNAAGVDIAADIIAMKAETVLIVADTNELQTDDVPGLISTLDAVVDTVKAETALIIADTNELQTDNIPGLIATAQADLDTITDSDGVILGIAGVAKIWDRALTGATHNIATSAGRRLRAIDAAFEVHSGTAQAGSTSTTIKLDTGASIIDNIYRGDRIIIIGGTGVEEHGICISYVGSTRVATMAETWVVTPDNTSEFEIVPASVDIETVQHAVQTAGDLAALIVTVDGVVDDILLDTVEIGTAGAGLSNINLPNQTMDISGNITGNLSGSVGSVTGAVGSVAGNVDGSVGSVIGDINTSGGTIKTLDALDTAQDTQHAATQGATFSGVTDSLEAIRDRGDAAWTTGAGGSDRLLMVDTTIATLATQVSFTLTAGSVDNDAYNNCTIIIEDVSTATQKAVGMVLDYDGGTKTITLKEALAFTIATTDKVYILAENSLKSTVANRQLDVTAGGAAGIDWANVENPSTALDLSGTDIQLVGTTTVNTDMRGTDSALTDKAGFSLSTAGILAVWHQALTAVVTAGSVGKLIKDEITAVRMATLTDWINGGRLDLLLDAIPTTAMRGTDNAATAANLATVDTVVDGIQTDLSNGTDGLGALKTLIDTVNTDLSNGTDGLGALKTLIDAVITDLSNGTDGLGALKTLIDALNNITSASVMTTQMTESYAADGVAPTPAQALLLILAMLTEFVISGTTLTAKKLDGSTTAGTFTLDDGTNPTSLTRVT